MLQYGELFSHARSLIARSTLRNRTPVGDGSRNAVSGSLTSSSATPNGCPNYWLKSAGGDAFEHLKQKAARGWLQRLVRRAIEVGTCRNRDRDLVELAHRVPRKRTNRGW